MNEDNEDRAATVKVTMPGMSDLIYGKVTGVIDDMLISTLTVLIGLAMGIYGEISDETSFNVSKALGEAMGDIMARANAGEYA